ncbi:hypothetical protein ACVNPX_02235 [Staphylococcus aureus]
MGQLQHGIDDETEQNKLKKYRDAEQKKKTAYDQAEPKAILKKHRFKFR